MEKKRAPSARQKEDVTLTTLIVAIHEAHKGRYGTTGFTRTWPGTGTGSARSGYGAWPGPLACDACTRGRTRPRRCRIR